MTDRSFGWWTRPTSAELFDITNRGDLLELQYRYRGTRRALFYEVLGHATDLGARSVVAEYRYLDADYRNEHSLFYSTTFRRYPSVAHRLHFFADRLPDDILDNKKPSRFDQFNYLGYAVIRPVPAGPVGRTLLPPADGVRPYVSCSTSEEVNLFGARLTATGAPFMTQESQLGVCVHITAWVCAYYHHLEFQGGRFLPGEIAALAPHEVGRLVPIPARGMSVDQLSSMLESAGLPPLVYSLDDLPASEDVFTIACRYLNSGFPVIVAGGGHAFVLVGYEYVIDADGTRRTQFLRHDDQAGLYLRVENPLLDRYRPWEYLVVPLPPKVYVSGETAEQIGRDWLGEVLHDVGDTDCVELLERLEKEKVVLRATAVRSNEFKLELKGRWAPPDLVAAYQWAQMSRWAWVVEAVDHDKWAAGERCVEAEVVIDATDHTGDPRPIAWRIPGQVLIWNPDLDKVRAHQLGIVGLLGSVSRVGGPPTCNAHA